MNLWLRFYVALTCGPGSSREPPPDVALELCVRFRDRQVLRRSCVSGCWGDAERTVAFFPFIRDQPFKVAALGETFLQNLDSLFTALFFDGCQAALISN